MAILLSIQDWEFTAGKLLPARQARQDVLGWTDRHSKPFSRSWKLTLLEVRNMEIFVFGSNLAGRHGAGAALEARKNHGAIYGQGIGLQGNSYAIPTKDGRPGTPNLRDPAATLDIDSIRASVAIFIEFAVQHPTWTFNVARIGCGLAGYLDVQIAPLFKGAPDNCHLPVGWRDIISSTISMTIMEKEWVAIIGSREPTARQIIAVREFIATLNPDTQAVISGCAYGIDAIALEEGQKHGIETIGILPWPKYNLEIQQFCTIVKCIDEFKEQHRKEAYDSVGLFHPAVSRLSQGAMKLHARNYGIIRWAGRVVACPSSKPGGGGTGQGIRLAEHLKIPLTTILP